MKQTSKQKGKNMPRKKPEQKSAELVDKVPFDSIIWVLNNLSEKELAAHDANPYSPQDILDKSNEMIEDGFQFSWKYDGYSKSRQVSAMCLFEGCTNTGLAISARGEDISDCMSICLYKYYNVADRDLRAFTDVVPTSVRG